MFLFEMIDCLQKCKRDTYEIDILSNFNNKILYRGSINGMPYKYAFFNVTYWSFNFHSRLIVQGSLF